MRLDDFDPNAIDVEDQRGSGGGLAGGLGLPHLGCGGIVLVLLISLVFKVNPLSVLGLMQGQGGGAIAQSAPVAAGSTAAESCRINPESLEACNALSSLNKTWEPQFEAGSFRRPHLVFYTQSGRSGCGSAQSAMGPFYCPEDQGIYLDTDFYRQLDQQLGAGGQFARDYVIAHEYGHHIQNLLGISGKVAAEQQRNPDEANALSVRLELQADCFAGVWANKNKDRMDSGDLQSGMNAAHQIGDDTLMKEAGQNPNEAAFTHGSSEQRMHWLKTGIDSGDINACNTFAAGAG